MATIASSIAIGIAIILGYSVFVGLLTVILKICLKLPFEWTRKLLHIGYTMSIFVYLNIFDTWYTSVLSLLILTIVFYVALAIAERFSVIKRILPEREDGDFKRQVILAQLSIAILITIFWGLLGTAWVYVAVVAVMVWGYGDAAAALVGKTFGRNKIKNRWVEGTKTVEGTLAMFVVAALAIFFTLMIYAGEEWYECLGVALLVAPASALIELFSRKGLDTLTVPLSAAGFTLALMFIFSV